MDTLSQSNSCCESHNTQASRQPGTQTHTQTHTHTRTHTHTQTHTHTHTLVLFFLLLAHVPGAFALRVAVNVHMPKDRVTGSNLGYGFVEFLGEEDAEYALKIMNMINLYGKPIRVNKVLPSPSTHTHTHRHTHTQPQTHRHTHAHTDTHTVLELFHDAQLKAAL